MVEAPVSRDRPNVVLVILDSLRADHVDLDPSGATPNIARLASSGITFDRAIAPAGWTLPSHVSILTGSFPHQHGVVSVGTPKETLDRARLEITRLAHAGQFLPDALSALGYATFLGSANVWVGPASGFARSFGASAYSSFPPRPRGPAAARIRVTPHTHTVRLPPRFRSIIPLQVRHAGRSAIEAAARRWASVRRSWTLLRWAASASDKGAAAIIDDFARWLDTSDGPFFALFNLIETHEPHISPEAPGRKDLRSVLAALRYRGPRLQRHNFGLRRIPGGALARIKSAYRHEVAYADGCIGRIVEAIRARGLVDRTVIIVGSDHGEAFGEHDLVGHGLSLGEAVARTVLVASGPGIPEGRVSDPVSLCSLAATIYELAGGDPDHWPTPSLLSAGARGWARIEAEPPGAYFRPPGLRPDRVPAALLEPSAAFYSGRLKLIVGSVWGRALYDLAGDPEERTNLIGSRPVPNDLARMESEWRAALRE